MSTDQICAYCEHRASAHTNGTGLCGALGPGVGLGCGCPRFVANTDTETHEVMAQVLAEADRRKSVLEVAVESERAMGGTHYCDCGSLPEHPPEVHVRHATMLSPAPDLINHPPHYTAHPSGVECIQITEHMNFNIGNAVKYLWRFGLKSVNSIEDLKKARWYVDREIERLSR